MADKRDKIAAARKKLKQYQARQKDRDGEPCNEPTPPDIDLAAQTAPSSSLSSASSTTELPVTVPLPVEPVPDSHWDRDSNGQTSDGAASISNYFTTNKSTGAFPVFNSPQSVLGMDIFGSIEPQIAPVPGPSQRQPDPPAPVPAAVFDASVYSINKISDEIGNLIANANADLGPQNTILELESEKADLARQLNAEKLENEELRLRLRNNQSVVDELTIEIDRLRVENNTRVTVELGPLQEQLQMQIQAVGVLVGEKAELTASLAKCQSLVKERTVACEEIEYRLEVTEATVQKLTRELEEARPKGQQYERLEERIGSQVAQYQQEAERFRKLHDDLQEDLAELRQNLTVRSEEYQAAQQALEQARSELSLARIRIDQLSSVDDDRQDDSNAKIESLAQQNLIKAQQLKDLQEVVKQIGSERDQSNQQYQNYVLHLNKEIGNLAEKIQELTDENNRLAKSEEAAVRFANELERQIQQQMLQQQTLAQASRDEGEQPVSLPQTERQNLETVYEQKLEVLQKRCNDLERERDKLQDVTGATDVERDRYEALLKQSEEQIELLQLTVERLQLDKPDVAKLLAEIESGKVGASRAVTQNNELKAQLEEMQRAFVQISNDKLNLTDKLQTELHLGKEMKANYGHLEAELAAIREQLHYKDEEMIRLAHENTELNKQIFQHSQEIDRLRYYESRSNDAVTLQRELETQRRTVEELERQLSASSPTVNGDGGGGEDRPKDVRDVDRHEIETLRQEKQELVKALNRFQQHRSVSGNDEDKVDQQLRGDRPSSIVSSISTLEAMEKLQERFRRTMVEVAELTEERQVLEHLVLQLQDETDTIGEYITLYQQQRRLLKQKDMERNLQLQQLADDREMMKLKLKELNYLVHRLVLEQQGGGSVGAVVPTSRLSPADHIVDLPDPSAPTAGGASPTSVCDHHDDHYHHSSDTEISSNGNDGAVPNVHIKATETAGRILSLLTDMKEANILFGSGVQHCSCCSGRLETV